MGYLYRKMISLVLHTEILRPIRPLLQIQPSLTVSIFLDPPVGYKKNNIKGVQKGAHRKLLIHNYRLILFSLFISGKHCHTSMSSKALIKLELQDHTEVLSKGHSYFEYSGV